VRRARGAAGDGSSFQLGGNAEAGIRLTRGVKGGGAVAYACLPERKDETSAHERWALVMLAARG
jgi:hypothetical protein